MSTHPEAMAPTSRKIIDAVCRAFDISNALIVGKCRKRHLVDARHAAAYLIRNHTHLSLNSIGRVLGGRHHAMIISGLREADRLMDTDPEFLDMVRQARQYMIQPGSLVIRGVPSRINEMAQ